MHTVCELKSFRRDATEAGMTQDEIDEVVDILSHNPTAGDEIQGTGGCRKVRLAGRGKGKSGGYRAVTFTLRCGRVAPAGQSRDVKASPLANILPAVAMLVSNGDQCSAHRRGERVMSDGLSKLYHELLSGSYDCVDRIVLNAYFGMGHSPGGFACGGGRSLDRTTLWTTLT